MRYTDYPNTNVIQKLTKPETTYCERFSDIWLFDFSDENEVRFRLPPPTFWQKAKLIFKRIF